MKSVEVRSQLIETLQLDLIGPNGPLGDPQEVLRQRPSTWYLTGFLVPTDASEDQRVDAESADTMDVMEERGGTDDAATPDRPAARRSFMPSSMGLSLLVARECDSLDVTVQWGDYRMQADGPEAGAAVLWHRTPRSESLSINVPKGAAKTKEIEVPNSPKLFVSISVRDVPPDNLNSGIPAGTRSVSLFLVNRRVPAGDVRADEAFAFQTHVKVESPIPFVARPSLHALESHEWDERVADLQYRDALEYSVGHSVSTRATTDANGDCMATETSWLPSAEVERVAPAAIEGVELRMETLSFLKDADDAMIQLGPFAEQYRKWIEKQHVGLDHLPDSRKETVASLIDNARVAADRIENGIKLLADDQCLEAFRIANKAMARQAKLRLARQWGKDPAEVVPSWRPFQLAFILMNLQGIADPKHSDHKTVDLLFFPTGGGKTEAYLGLAAFSLILRRLRNPGITSAGMTVLMRYTLRLLTLDQLGRAAALVCALELERQNDVDKLGEWPFEIGLWVGQAATPNRMGKKGETGESARSKTRAYWDNDSRPSPIPLEECPWCAKKFQSQSFRLLPNSDHPRELRIKCLNRRCDFNKEGRTLPILAVDDQIYQRLPCFLIATVDKFAAMPWTGEVGKLFGKVQRYDQNGFYGPCEPGEGNPIEGNTLLPPELIIQDELHLISGPLGTIAGLYETAIDGLSTYKLDDVEVKPKIIASTATVRRADSQIQALFNRRNVDIFPPPGPNRRDSFFARTHNAEESSPRLYLGVAAQGKSPKVVMLRVYLALMAGAQKLYKENGGKKNTSNPVDPYMTVLGYFNSLRELGGARRLIEDEVLTQLAGRGARKRVGEAKGLFVDRKISFEPVELTSRVSTDKVSEAKQRLGLPFHEKERVDVAIATNMISVGLDITRLGLMVVFGQPKTSSEYIQSTSRVGRDHEKPGLVVTLLNIHRPRDRSHYERYEAYHDSFYRNVEATSVTPFSPRALDRGLAGTLVALARQGHAPMTPAKGATEVLKEQDQLQYAVDALVSKAKSHNLSLTEDEINRIASQVSLRSKDLLDEWNKQAKEMDDIGGTLQYQREAGNASPLLHEFLHPDLKNLPPSHSKMKFRANRSMRDVEPSVNLWLKTIDGIELEEPEE